MVSRRPGHKAGILILIAGLLACGALASSAGPVDLLWRPSASTLRSGESLNVDLVAQSDTPETISAVDVIIKWNPVYLSGIQKGPSQPFWLLDGFLNPQPDGLNSNTEDGSVLYTGWSALFSLVNIDSAGLVLASFSFTALQPVSHTAITIPATFGALTRTAVFDGSTPNTDVTGITGSVAVTIVPEPHAGSCLMAGLLIASFIGGGAVPLLRLQPATSVALTPGERPSAPEASSS